MKLSNNIKTFFGLQKKINLSKLPSQGLFYKEDFKLWIKKADVNDILEYEHGYIKDNLISVLTRLKKIVENNVILSSGYKYIDIKSIDIVFIFLEIVKLTKKSPIKIEYFDDVSRSSKVIDFDENSFNYFEINDEIIKYYNSDERVFDIDGYKYSLPSIGIENCLTNFIISKQYSKNPDKYNDYSYEFMNFLGHKGSISFSEIENLIEIFNYDIDEDQKIKVKNICKKFTHIHKYSLIKDRKVIDINSKIDLENIWKTS